ncbi:unnamed protein product [Medioppia subpectinata]|uniref:BZIP domain-containing protein n=1 Tax=Medioppia subpectinata TaxID=1979941 RepID=A0A7R9Q7H4_9ACAR|nr:unnamed protein product [Medioppia subpectinata]CAG2114808.1 unnamed protein product [Medioppia subpectinata]
MDSEAGPMSTEDYVHDLSSLDLEHLEEVVKQESAKIAAASAVNHNNCRQLADNSINSSQNCPNDQQLRLVHNVMANGGLPDHRKQQIALAANTPGTPPNTGSPSGNGNSLSPSPAFAGNMTSPVMAQTAIDTCNKHNGLIDDNNSMNMSWLTAQLRYGANGGPVMGSQEGPLDLRGQCGQEIDNPWLSPNIRRDYGEMQTNHNNPHVNSVSPVMHSRLMQTMVNPNLVNNSIDMHQSQQHPQQHSHHNNGNNQLHNGHSHHNNSQLHHSFHSHGLSGHNSNDSSIVYVNGGGGGKSGDNLNDEQLINLTVRELNKKLHGFPREDVVKMKQKRRTLKNRGYAQNCRTKRLAQRHELEAKLRLQQNELGRNRYECDKMRVELDKLRLNFDKLRQAYDKVCQERDFYRQQLSRQTAQTGSSQQMAPNTQQVTNNTTTAQINARHNTRHPDGSLSSVSASSTPSSPEFYL